MYAQATQEMKIRLLEKPKSGEDKSESKGLLGKAAELI